MKITKVEIIPVNVPSHKVLTLSRYGRLGEGKPYEFILTKVYTDEGVTGVGECPPLPPLSPESQSVIASMIKNWIAPQILGLDPFDLETIWEKMDYVAPTYPMSKAAVDIALWDIMGKSLGIPVYRLLGGSTVNKIPIVALIGIRSPQEVAAEAAKLVEEGYKGIRLKIGPDRDVECVRAIREAVGDDVTLRVDCNQGYSAPRAIRIIKAMEKFDVELVEQPTIWWDFNSLATVAKSVDTPIMPHESLYQMSDVKTLIEMGAVGVLGLKTYRPGGGITSARRILEMARVLNIPCLMHDDLELGVSLAASTHIITAFQRVITHKCELSGFPEWIAEDVVTTPMKIGAGFAEVPKGSGLGVELDSSKIDKYATSIIRCEK